MTYPDNQTRDQWLATIEKQYPHEFYKHPENVDQPIWRYMDVAKFLSLLEDSSLFFPRATLFEDKFEGSVSRENLRRRPDLIEDHLKQRRAGFPHVSFSAAEDNVTRKSMGEMFKTMAQVLEWERNWTYVSCWHMNDHESDAMWKLYAATNQAIAVRSTFSKLKQCLRSHHQPPGGDPILGTVYYVDYTKDVVLRNFRLSEFFYKRMSFAHERELRAIIQELPLVPVAFDAAGNVTGSHYDAVKVPIAGKVLKVDIDQLIEAIYIAPTAPSWFKPLVEGVMGRYGLTKPVHKSDLDAAPVY